MIFHDIKTSECQQARPPTEGPKTRLRQRYSCSYSNIEANTSSHIAPVGVPKKVQLRVPSRRKNPARVQTERSSLYWLCLDPSCFHITVFPIKTRSVISLFPFPVYQKTQQMTNPSAVTGLCYTSTVNTSKRKHLCRCFLSRNPGVVP